MAWFKKLEEAETQADAGSRGAAQPSVRPEPRESRAEPREPRVEQREPRPEQREPRVEQRLPRVEQPAPAAAAAKSAEARPVEPPTRQAPAPQAAPRVSVLGATLRFRGDLSAQEDLLVQGSVEGSITHTQSLTIGTEGSMKGQLRARVIVIEGKMEGDLFATESVHIRATARVTGNVFAPRIAIQDGAFFQGQVELQPSMPLQEAAVERVLSGV